MTPITTRRLRAQRLIGEQFGSVADAVSWFGAVQSQDYGAAKWALGQRIAGATESEIDSAFDDGTVLRTHVLRPTWHFVHPRDIRWMLALSGPRIMNGMPGRHRQLGLDTETFSRAFDVFAAALSGGRHRTRAQLADALQQAGIAPDGQRAPHLLMAAELEGLVVSGPRHGKQFTWALMDERVPASPPLERSDAIGELARRYFISHGPAQVQDSAWWSGLSPADARAGVSAAGRVLERVTLGGVEYWHAADAERPARPGVVAHLLPNFDEYTVAYRDRSAVLDPGRPVDLTLLSFGSVLANVVVLNGRLLGAWRRVPARDGVLVEVRSFGGVTPRVRSAVGQAALRLSRFVARDVEVRWA